MEKHNGSLTMSAGETCKIFHEELKDASAVVEVRQKGADGINSASVQRGDDIVISAGEKIHIKCRKQYIHPKNIQFQQKTKVELPKRSAREATSPFNSQTDCLFCGATVSVIHWSADYSYVETDAFVKSVLVSFDNRSDEWAFTVKGRIEFYCCVYMLRTVFTIRYVVLISVLGNHYHYSSRMSQRQSGESLAGPKTKIRSRHS